LPLPRSSPWPCPPRRIGEALERAHDGDLTLDFGADAYEVRAHWQR
jgi:hypothetical protein